MASGEDLLTGQGQWAFGPWVALKVGTAMIPGAFYEYSWSPGDIQWRESPIIVWVLDTGDRCRRAYRIGEWYDHDGSRECPLELGTRHEWLGSTDDVHVGVGVVEPGEDWRFVRRFRPVGAARDALHDSAGPQDIAEGGDA